MYTLIKRTHMKDQFSHARESAITELCKSFHAITEVSIGQRKSGGPEMDDAGSTADWSPLVVSSGYIRGKCLSQGLED